MRVSGAIAWILRIFSSVYHLVVALFLFGLGLVALLSGDAHSMNFVFLPWEGDTLMYALLGLGIFGITSAILAFAGKTRTLLKLTAVVFVVFLIRGLVFSPLRFDTGFMAWKTAVYLTIAALIALIGAFMNPRPDRKRI
jgi:hypothetical protein